MTKAIYASDNWIQNENGNLMGQICIRPDAILWRRPGNRKWKTVPMDEFIEWMDASGREVRRKQPYRSRIKSQ